MAQVLTTEMWIEIGYKLLRIGMIFAGAALILRFLGVFVERFFLSQAAARKFYLEEKRIRTLSALLKSMLRYTVYFIGTVMVLQEFHIDTTSVIAGAGIIGLALGVGAQSLVKDLITGFFIILEDQYAVGDYIVSGDMAGKVEDFGFRVTKLRDANGILHIIPNGLITRVSNYTRGHMTAVINVPVPYDAGIATVLELLERVCAEAAETLPELLEAPKVLGVVDLKPGEIVVRIIAKTVPLEQVKVEAALRHRIRLTFEEARIPAPMTGYFPAGRGQGGE